jgi:hypothetical protein
MIRKMLQAILCITLCPLLVAQQTAQQEVNPASAPPIAVSSPVTLTRDTVTRFIEPINVPFAKIQVGTKVRFTVDRDVAVGDVKLIEASTPVDGVVVRVIHASHFKNRTAQMVIKVRETVSGRTTDIFLRCYNPDDNLQRPYTQTGPHFTAKGFVIVALVVVALLFVAVFNTD